MHGDRVETVSHLNQSYIDSRSIVEFESFPDHCARQQCNLHDDRPSKPIRSFVDIDREHRQKSLTSESLVNSLSAVLMVRESEHSLSDSLLVVVERLD